MGQRAKTKKKHTPTSRRVVSRILITIFLAGILAASIYLLKNPTSVHFLAPKKHPLPSSTATAPHLPGIGQETVSINLYFADPESDFLMVESRRVSWKADDVEDHMRVVMRELVRGPQGPLVATIPPHTIVRGLRVEKDSLGIVDFSGELSRNHPGGSSAEIQTIYSIVNSLVLNLPSLKQVKILIEGDALDTLKGHIDCRAPFEANLSVIKAG
jgi:hypothetical protein